MTDGPSEVQLLWNDDPRSEFAVQAKKYILSLEAALVKKDAELEAWCAENGLEQVPGLKAELAQARKKYAGLDEIIFRQNQTIGKLQGELAQAKEGIVSLDASKRHLVKEFERVSEELAQAKAEVESYRIEHAPLLARAESAEKALAEEREARKKAQDAGNEALRMWREERVQLIQQRNAAEAEAKRWEQAFQAETLARDADICRLTEEVKRVRGEAFLRASDMAQHSESLEKLWKEFERMAQEQP